MKRISILVLVFFLISGFKGNFPLLTEVEQARQLEQRVPINASKFSGKRVGCNELLNIVKTSYEEANASFDKTVNAVVANPKTFARTSSKEVFYAVNKSVSFLASPRVSCVGHSSRLDKLFQAMGEAQSEYERLHQEDWKNSASYSRALNKYKVSYNDYKKKGECADKKEIISLKEMKTTSEFMEASYLLDLCSSSYEYGLVLKARADAKMNKKEKWAEKKKADKEKLRVTVIKYASEFKEIVKDKCSSKSEFYMAQWDKIKQVDKLDGYGGLNHEYTQLRGACKAESW